VGEDSEDPSVAAFLADPEPWPEPVSGADLLDRERGDDRLRSADLAEALSALEDRPWPEWHQGKPITPRQIAKLLEPFDLTPGTIRTTGSTAKGYKLEQFTDAFARYLPPP
jgi:hypothetical protein